MFSRPWYQEKAERYLDELAPGSVFVSIRAAARLLDISRQEATLFMAWLASVTEVYDEDDAEDEGQQALGLPPLNIVLSPDAAPRDQLTDVSITEGAEKKTWIADGLIWTDLGLDYGLFSLSKRDFEQFRKDYSRLWGGGSLNQSQMAYKWGLPSAHAVDLFRRVHGLRQTSIPHTDEELNELGVDAAVEETLASKRQSYMLKLQEKERVREKADAEKWRGLETSLRGVLASLTAPEPVTTEEIAALLDPPAAPYALMISLSDLHIGKLVLGPDGQVVWNRAMARAAGITAVRDLLRQTLVLGRPDEIQLLLCSDGLHVDGPNIATTGGTPQGEQSEGTYREMVEDYLNLAQEAIGICRAIAPVRALIVEGNHDRTSSMMIGLMLERLYAGDSRVSVLTQRGGGLIQFNYGENTLAFLHGEYLKRPGDLFKIMLATADGSGDPLLRHRLAWSGHLHHERVEDLGGIKHHVLPALCPGDEWHKRNFYVGAKVETQAFVIRRSGGKSAVFYTTANAV